MLHPVLQGFQGLMTCWLEHIKAGAANAKGQRDKRTISPPATSLMPWSTSCVIKGSMHWHLNQ